MSANMDVREAIERRRSIRRYKSEPLSEEVIRELLEAARLAPSGTNHQPWRFVVVTDKEAREDIRTAAYGQRFLGTAPLVLVCCADLTVYGRDTEKRVAELAESGALNPERMKGYSDIWQSPNGEPLSRFKAHAMFNVALAMENIALRAVSLGLGSCIVQYMKAREIAEQFQLPETTVVVALMAVGFPDEDPAARPRVPLEEIVIKREERKGREG